MRFSNERVMRERALARSRRIDASCGLARSSNSPLGRIFRVMLAASFSNSGGNGPTISKASALIRVPAKSPRERIQRPSTNPGKVEQRRGFERSSFDAQT